MLNNVNVIRYLLLIINDRNMIDIDSLKVEGQPDEFDLIDDYTGEVVGSFEYADEDAYPFIIANGKIKVGQESNAHADMGYKAYKSMPGFVTGRIWLTFAHYAYITFWNEDEDVVIDTKLTDELLDYFSINHEDAIVVSFDDNRLHPYDSWCNTINAANDEQKEAHMLHMMNAQDKHDATSEFRVNRDANIGNKLGNMTVAQYKSMLYGESRIRKVIKDVINEYIENEKRMLK